MDPSKVYRRIFNRTITADVDVEVDDAFREANFKDFFGKTWLSSTENLKKLTFNEVLRDFWESNQANPSTNSFYIFCAADGGGIKVTEENKKWLNQHIRFAAFVAGGTNGAEEPFADNDENSWTLCIVGSQELQSTERFLQVASWDGHVFRFYARDPVQLAGEDPKKQQSGWVYQGVSTDAFKEDSYLGPFNGHVNGGLIMKELHKPWLHWKTDANDPTGNFSGEVRATFSKQYAPYLSDASTLSNVTSADQMEPFITSGIGNWYASRWKMDFLNDNGHPRQSITGLKRWIAHILLTTTVNIHAAVQYNNGWLMPVNHIYNSELASQGDPTKIWPTNIGQDFLSFQKELYDQAIKKDPQLALIQNIDPDDPPEGYTPVVLDASTLANPDPKADPEPITVVQVEVGEGDVGVFTILQPSYEDAKAAYMLMTSTKKQFTLLSQTTYNAMVMVDPWNPVYSWKRGVLLQYVPDDATFNATTKVYDMEQRFIDAVKASPRMQDDTSPEYEFIQNLEKTPDYFRGMMSEYLKNVKSRLKSQNGIADYLKLAESRRRIYRPVPLDEFALTLPWAWLWKYNRPLEMTKLGTIQEIDDRGKKFFDTWIGTLSGPNPVIIPRPDANDHDDIAVLMQLRATASAKPKTPNLAASCESSLSVSSIRSGRCPFQARTKRSVQLNRSIDTLLQPTWDDDIKALFTRPYWIGEKEREDVASTWKRMMLKYGSPIPPDGKDSPNLTLDDYDHVKYQAITIYQHCASQSMPITSDPSHYWPDDALETFRTWVNQGCRKSKDGPLDVNTRIPKPNGRQVTFRTRKDIRDLTTKELQTYRAKLQDILQVESLQSKWQELGELHAWWCLHYQEATFLWHRCWLKYVENLIDFPIPYWNGFASEAADPVSPSAGLPQMFLEETYVHTDGTTRKNPLKYAFSYHGMSKNGNSKYVQRDPILVAGRPSEPGKALDKWNAKIGLFSKYHKQIVNAMKLDKFSSAEGLGAAWAAIPAFKEDMEDKYYVCQQSFDGWFEQAHDNFHGWIGGENGDMSDNTYTAFDPVFLSYHCNMDRLFEQYLRSKPNTQFSSNFPLRPFVNGATDIDYTNPNIWAYTTIGDMAKHTAANGYIYAPPANPDIFTPSKAAPPAHSKGGTPFALIQPPTFTAPSDEPNDAGNRKAYILFKNVVCTQLSYRIDIFLKGAESTVPDHNTNPDFVGQLFRFGMGQPPDGEELKNRGRCQKNAVTRFIEVEGVCAKKIGEVGFVQVVREFPSGGIDEGRDVPESEWSGWKGFKGELVWVME